MDHVDRRCVARRSARIAARPCFTDAFGRCHSQIPPAANNNAGNNQPMSRPDASGESRTLSPLPASPPNTPSPMSVTSNARANRIVPAIRRTSVMSFLLWRIFTQREPSRAYSHLRTSTHLPSSFRRTDNVCPAHATFGAPLGGATTTVSRVHMYAQSPKTRYLLNFALAVELGPPLFGLAFKRGPEPRLADHWGLAGHQKYHVVGHQRQNGVRVAGLGGFHPGRDQLPDRSFVVVHGRRRCSVASRIGRDPPIQFLDHLVHEPPLVRVERQRACRLFCPPSRGRCRRPARTPGPSPSSRTPSRSGRRPTCRSGRRETPDGGDWR